MDIENINRANELAEKRKKAIAVYKAARSDPNVLDVYVSGLRIFDVVPREVILSATHEAAADVIVAIDKELLALGVRSPKFELADMDAAAWRRTAEMYLRVWIRDVGGKLFKRHHLIDALAMTTQWMRERAEMSPRLASALRGMVNADTNDELTRARPLAVQILADHDALEKKGERF